MELPIVFSLNAKALAKLLQKPKRDFPPVNRSRPLMLLAVLVSTLTIAFGLCRQTIAAAAQPCTGNSAVSGQRIDSSTLRKTASAFSRIRRINAETMEALRKTKNQEQQQRIVADAKAQQHAAFRQSGITPD
ncbi:MAG: hypothetical protein ACREP6_15455, partial [Candidatus Binataceae bacterium]